MTSTWGDLYLNLFLNLNPACHFKFDLYFAGDLNGFRVAGQSENIHPKQYQCNRLKFQTSDSCY